VLQSINLKPKHTLTIKAPSPISFAVASPHGINALHGHPPPNSPPLPAIPGAGFFFAILLIPHDLNRYGGFFLIKNSHLSPIEIAIEHKNISQTLRSIFNIVWKNKVYNFKIIFDYKL